MRLSELNQVTEASADYDNPKYEFGLMTKEEFLEKRNPYNSRVSAITPRLGNIDKPVPSNAKLIQQVRAGREILNLKGSEDGYYLTRKNDDETLVGVITDHDETDTIVMVAQEYKGFGLGQILAKQWYKTHNNTSGGLSDAGKANAIETWAARVREFVSKGWYTDLVRDGKLTPARVKQIVSGLPKRRTSTNSLITYTYVSETHWGPVVYIITAKEPFPFPQVHAFAVVDPSAGTAEFYSRNDRYNRDLILAVTQTLQDRNLPFDYSRSGLEDSIYKMESDGDLELDGSHAKIKKPINLASKSKSTEEMIERGGWGLENLRTQADKIGAMRDIVL